MVVDIGQYDNVDSCDGYVSDCGIDNDDRIDSFVVIMEMVMVTDVAIMVIRAFFCDCSLYI